MPTMTVPSASMRRLKLAAAAARSAAADPTLRPSVGDGGQQARQQLSSGTRIDAAEDIPAPPTPPRRTAVKVGERVLVCTPVTAPSGCVLEFDLAAVVVSAAGDDGCVEVVYDGRFPPEDPWATVRVSMDRIVEDIPPPTSSASEAEPASRGRKRRALAGAARKWIFSF